MRELGVRAGDEAVQGHGDVGDDGAHERPSIGGAGRVKQRAKADSTSAGPSTRSDPWEIASAGAMPAWTIAAMVLASVMIRVGSSGPAGVAAFASRSSYMRKVPRSKRASRSTFTNKNNHAGTVPDAA